jgi:hypothetical protein
MQIQTNMSGMWTCSLDTYAMKRRRHADAIYDRQLLFHVARLFFKRYPDARFDIIVLPRDSDDEEADPDIHPQSRRIYRTDVPYGIGVCLGTPVISDYTCFRNRGVSGSDNRDPWRTRPTIYNVLLRRERMTDVTDLFIDVMLGPMITTFRWRVDDMFPWFDPEDIAAWMLRTLAEFDTPEQRARGAKGDCRVEAAPLYVLYLNTLRMHVWCLLRFEWLVPGVIDLVLEYLAPRM